MLTKCSFLTVLAWLGLAGSLAAQTPVSPMPPELDYFPSRLHAAVYRNWDIVPHERLATVLGTDVKSIRRTGKDMGLTTPPPLTPEVVHRNVEIVLRRNWALLPRSQIEGLLGYSAREVDAFLGKEISLRALLASPPAGLAPLSFETPNEATRERVAWFRAQVKKHLAAVAATPAEPRLAFKDDLCQAHDPADYVPGTKPRPEDADLRSRWKLQVPQGAGVVLETAVQDFVEYCEKIHHVKRLTRTREGSSIGGSAKVFSLLLDPAPGGGEKFALSVGNNSIVVRSGSEHGLARGLLELERRMGERGGPFLAPCQEVRQPAFSPRYLSSYSSLLTDVLGQDVVEPFPEGYLRRLAHQDATGVWIYALLEDLVPSPVFEGLGSGDEARLQRLRDVVNRAKKYGLKVYIYLNEPRAQSLSFFEKYPEAKGQPEGSTAALCTSTTLVQQHLRGSFEKLFRAVPGLGGVFVITASENLSNCYSHTRQTACPRCAKRAGSDVIAEAVRCMAEGVRAAAPEAQFIVWDWSWHAILGEQGANDIIRKLPANVALMADFERGTVIQRGGISLPVEEYSISVVGPSPRAKLRSEQARENGFNFLAKIQLSTTWECGTVPFIPVPNLLARKAAAMRQSGVTGAMQTWTIGSYPSPNTEAFALAQWNPELSEQEVLHRVAARRYGLQAAEDAVRGWTKLSNALAEEYPYCTHMYAGPLQHGPSLPLYHRDIPHPYGRATLFNCKDDWRNWSPPYGPELMMKLLRHLSERWAEGMRDLERAAKAASGSRRRIAERDLAVAWMFDYTCRAYADNIEFYIARDSGNLAGMKQVAQRQLQLTQEALRRVNADSRLGWEAELQYFYRPEDILERLLSLDAVLEPSGQVPRRRL